MKVTMPVPDDPRVTMTLARGFAIGAYAGLEQSMCLAITELAGMDRDVGTLFFYRMVNSRSRTVVLEKLLNRRFKRDFNLFRNSILKRIGVLDAKRNGIVHWTLVSEVSSVDGHLDLGRVPDKVTLRPPTFWIGAEREPEALTAEDIFDFSRDCSVVSRAINAFIMLNLHDSLGESPERGAEIRQVFLEALPNVLPQDHPLYEPSPYAPPENN